jgi:non-ribosomal peptide synthetase component F
MLPAAERRQVVEGWNATERPYPAGACVHDLLAAQAARTPDSVAVSRRGERLTYGSWTSGRTGSPTRCGGAGGAGGPGGRVPPAHARNSWSPSWEC